MADKKVFLKDLMTGDRIFPASLISNIYNDDGSKWTPPEAVDTSKFAPKEHTHAIDDVSGLSDQLSSLKTSVSEGKALVAAAVTDKGVQTAADAAFQLIAENIGKISTGKEVFIAMSDSLKDYEENGWEQPNINVGTQHVHVALTPRGDPDTLEIRNLPYMPSTLIVIGYATKDASTNNIEYGYTTSSNEGTSLIFWEHDESRGDRCITVIGSSYILDRTNVTTRRAEGDGISIGISSDYTDQSGSDWTQFIIYAFK